jgi:hypothetical protein
VTEDNPEIMNAAGSSIKNELETFLKQRIVANKPAGATTLPDANFDLIHLNTLYIGELI